MLLVSHQFVMGILTEHLYKPGPMTSNLETGDFVKTGHKIPNATPLYWPVHVFKDAQGHYVSVPASTGAQGGMGPTKTPGAAQPKPAPAAAQPQAPQAPQAPAPDSQPAVEPRGLLPPARSDGPANLQPTVDQPAPAAAEPQVSQAPAPESQPAVLPPGPLSANPADRPANLQARVGQPAEWPVAPGGPGGLFQTAKVMQAGVRSAAATAADAWLGKTVISPAQAVADTTWKRFEATPLGRLTLDVSGATAKSFSAITADGTPVGNTLAFLDQNLVRNEPLWQAVGQVGAAARMTAQAGFASTMAAVMAAHQSGLLRMESFVTDGRPLTPEQSEVQRAINIPRGEHVTYFITRGEKPVTVDGKVYKVPTRAFVAIAGGQNVVLLPATGLGKPGAQPWIGYDTGSKRLTMASSSVAAGAWALAGFSSGTTNFNTSGRADLQALRGLFNIAAFTSGPDSPTRPGGPTTNRLWSIFIADPLSTFFTTTVNIGPLAIVGERYRNPQTEHVILGLGGPEGSKGLKLATSQHDSRVVPAFPLVGAGTFTPEAGDWQLMEALTKKGLGDVRSVFERGVSAPAAPRQPAALAR